ncbi:hypothetical protein H2201_005974 [Coniosporium apollinis]|uniref:DUF7730 domain-containing protein n=1 Tax=Coniosporium apollinis TaxID=61459 RepID=A0ABQ9NNH1_9PEZI|nr:hypothetical protein H2201_005974 [Coniosporium apollinis]
MIEVGVIQTNREDSITKPEVDGGKPQTPDHFPLFKLPAELRNHIYGYALRDPTGVVLKHGIRNRKRAPIRHWTSRVLSRRGSIPSPSLLRVSKQVSGEAIPILYSSNSFSFRSTSALLGFLRLMKYRRHWLRHITIAGTYNRPSAWSAFKLLPGCTRLRSLNINAEINPFSVGTTAEAYAQKFYWDASPWLIALARANENKFAAFELLNFDPGRSLELGYGHGPYEEWTDMVKRRETEKFFAHLKRLLAAKKVLKKVP